MTAASSPDSGGGVDEREEGEIADEDFPAPRVGVLSHPLEQRGEAAAAAPPTRRPPPRGQRRSGLIHDVQEDPQGAEGPAEGPSHLMQRRLHEFGKKKFSARTVLLCDQVASTKVFEMVLLMVHAEQEVKSSICPPRKRERSGLCALR